MMTKVLRYYLLTLYTLRLKSKNKVFVSQWSKRESEISAAEAGY